MKASWVNVSGTILIRFCLGQNHRGILQAMQENTFSIQFNSSEFIQQIFDTNVNVGMKGELKFFIMVGFYIGETLLHLIDDTLDLTLFIPERGESSNPPGFPSITPKCHKIMK